MIEPAAMDSYSKFIYAMNSPVTREKYEGRLRKFLDFVGVPEGRLNERCNIFGTRGKADPSWVFNVLIRFLQLQKERVAKAEISGATVRNYVKTIKLFCEVSGITLHDWKLVTRGTT